MEVPNGDGSNFLKNVTTIFNTLSRILHEIHYSQRKFSLPEPLNLVFS